MFVVHGSCPLATTGRLYWLIASAARAWAMIHALALVPLRRAALNRKSRGQRYTVAQSPSSVCTFHLLVFGGGVFDRRWSTELVVEQCDSLQGRIATLNCAQSQETVCTDHHWGWRRAARTTEGNFCVYACIHTHSPRQKTAHSSWQSAPPRPEIVRTARTADDAERGDAGRVEVLACLWASMFL